MRRAGADGNARHEHAIRDNASHAKRNGGSNSTNRDSAKPGSEFRAGGSGGDAVKELPGMLRAAVLLMAVESLAVGGLALFLVYEDLTAPAASLVGALLVTAFTLGAAGTLGGLARALYHRRGGARGLSIVLQLMLLPIGYYMAKGELAWLGVPLIGLGLLVSGLLLAPSTTEALGLAERGRT
jgi:hypothetical protein